jgi:hypothetical protein
VDDQRIGGPLGVLDAGDVAALQAILGIGQRVLEGDLGLGHALHADAEPGLVHHGEHGAHALVRLAQQIAGRPVVVHHAGGIAVDAHLLLDLAAGDAVAGAEGAILVHEEFRHDEERDALDPIGPAGDLGQHEMDDVLGHVVFAGRDEDLLTGDLVAAIGLRFGLGPHQPQIGAAMGFGQVHGAGPVAGDHLVQVGRFLRLGPVGEDGGGGTMGQALVHGEGLVGGGEELAHGGAQDIGHSLAAELLGHVDAGPAVFLHLVEGGLETGGGVDHAVLEPTAMGVAHGVQGGQNLGGDLARLLEDRGGEVAVEIGVARRFALREFQHVMQDELHVLGGGGIARHVLNPPGRVFRSLGPGHSAASRAPPRLASMSSTRPIWL